MPCSGEHTGWRFADDREMAVKESSQRAIIEQQFVQIADLQKAIQKFNHDTVGNAKACADDRLTRPESREGLAPSRRHQLLPSRLPTSCAKSMPRNCKLCSRGRLNLYRSSSASTLKW